MTLNAGHKACPSPLLHLSDTSNSTSDCRRNTVGSPTTAAYSAVAIPIQVQPVQARYPPPATTTSHASFGVHTNGVNAARGNNARFRSRSPAGGPTSPARQQQQQPGSQFGESGAGSTGKAVEVNGREPSQQSNVGPKSGVSSNTMQASRGGMGGIPQQQQQGQPVAMAKVPPRNANPAHSIISASLPATPHHFPRVNGASRSPSPSGILDSPRSTTSEPVRNVVQYPRPVCVHQPCLYETALVGARRRMPYSLGFDKLPKEKPRVEKLPAQVERDLTNETMEEFHRLKPSPDSETRRRKFLEKLARILNEEWPGYNTQVHAFGSTENYLAMEDSDVDVCITTNCEEIARFDGGGAGDEMWKTCKLTAALAKRGMERLVCVPGAKVPIVKIWDPEYQVACDMNVNNTMAIHNTRMIKTYVDIDDRVRPLALVIKNWTKQRLLNDAATGGTLSSYTWICLILNFLQTRDPPILPSLHARWQQKNMGKGLPMNDDPTLFDEDIATLRGYGRNNKETVGGLLFEFFKKYGYELDYDTSVVSVRAGRLLTKKEKMWTMSHNNRLCVEEPFNTDRNLGNTADDASMRGIHLEFRRAYKILSEHGTLAECCERFKFPPEESHSLPVPTPSRPVTLTKSTVNFGRTRGGFGGNQRGGRGYNTSYRSNPNRRTVNNTYNPAPQQQQQYYPELVGYMATTQEQMYALQVQAHAQAQLIQGLTQVAAYQNQHNQQMQHPNGSPSNSQITPEALNQFRQNMAMNLLSSVYGFHPSYYGYGFNPMETSTAPTSPPRTPGSTDARMDRQDTRRDPSRMGLGRGGRRGGDYNAGLRSQSQPPPYYAMNGYNRTPMGMSTTDDEDYADNSSNGKTPETPPAEEPLDEYVGYYTIGGGIQMHPDVALVDSHPGDVEQPFPDQKMMVDHNQRYASEKLPTPMISRDPSPRPLARQNKNFDVSPTNNRYREDERRSNHVNGGQSPLVQHRIPPSTRPIPFNGFDGASDRTTVNEVRDSVDQHMFGANPNMAWPEVSPVLGTRQTVMRNGHAPPSTMAEALAVQQEAHASSDAMQASPRRNQSGLPQLVWPTVRASSASPPKVAASLKPKDTRAAHEELGVLTPVPEARTPSPAARKPEPRPAQKATVNGIKPVAKIVDPVPPTPADKTASKNGNGRCKNSQSNKPNGHINGNHNNAARNVEPKVEAKPAEKSGNAKSKWTRNKQQAKNKRNASGAAAGNAVGGAINAQQPQAQKESERKGG